MTPGTAEIERTPATAEMAVATPPVELVASTAQSAAVRDCWRALWVSRVVVLLAGVGAVAAFGVGRARSAYDPRGVTSGFGWLGDLLAAPVARWDSVWYLVIAHYGYSPDLGSFTAPRTAFFPLYPLEVRGISTLGVPPIAAGVALSLVAFAAALYGIHRLCTLELGRLAGDLDSAHPRGDVARLAVLVTALAPMAFFFSAVYSEALYLALSVGVFWCARQGRWTWVAALGALASATRSAGVVLVVPALLLYLYGPREDREPDFPPRAWWRPRYALRRDVLWIAALPVGVGAYMAYLGLAGELRWSRSTPSRCGTGSSWGRSWACGTARGRRSTVCASCSPSSARTSTSPRRGAARS